MSSSSNAPDHAVIRAILRHGDVAPARAALWFHRDGAWRTLTYGELATRVRRVAGGLARRGVVAGARVVVLVPMSPELYVVLLAVASLGATAVFVEPASSPREMARTIRVTRPVAFIGIPKAHALRLMFPGATSTPVRVVVGSRAAARLLGAEALSAIEAEALAPPVVALEPAMPALLTFSSGSTGTPKGATRSHAFLGAQHAAVSRLLGERPEDVHLSAFSIVMLSTFVTGATAVIPSIGKGVDDIDGAAMVRAIRDLGVTVLSGSPAFLAPIFAAATPGELAKVRRVASGGAPVPVELCERAGEVLGLAATFTVVYGSTEAEPIATIDAATVRAQTGAMTRAGAGLCVGVPDAHLRLRLLRPSPSPIVVGPGGLGALEIAAGEVGEVVVAGPHVNTRYFRDHAAERATKIVDEAGVIWHRTGDAARRDDRGRLWLVGRVADIVRRGEAIYHPSAVEAAARVVPWVARAALVGDGRGGTLLVVESSERAPRLDELTTHLASRGIVIDRVALTPKLPVDPRHRAKIDYPAVRRQFIQESP